MLLVVAYSRAARETLRNVCRTHEETAVRRFGRAALLEATAFGAHLALRLRAKHGADVEVRWTAPFNEFETVSERVRAATAAYADRDHPSTPYAKFAAGTDHPSPAEMRQVELEPDR